MVNGSKLKVNCTVTLSKYIRKRCSDAEIMLVRLCSRTKKGLTNHVDKCAIARLEVIKEMEKQRDFSSQTQNG